MPPEPDLNRQRLAGKLIAEATNEELVAALRDRYIAIIFAGMRPSPRGNGAIEHQTVFGGDPILCAGMLTQLQVQMGRMLNARQTALEERGCTRDLGLTNDPEPTKEP